jgi:hypothetical protein
VGLIEQRKQIGSGIAVNLPGHLLTNKSLNSIGDKRWRQADHLPAQIFLIAFELLFDLAFKNNWT